LEKDAEQNVHLSTREQSSRLQGHKGPVSLILYGNTEGDFMLQAMNLRALENKNKQALPVYWRANRNEWVV